MEPTGLEPASTINYIGNRFQCHIKAIKLSIKSTRISEINSLDNLIALCPNCHWEFDAGLWQLSDIGVPG